MITQKYTFVKIHQIVHLKRVYVNYTLVEFIYKINNYTHKETPIHSPPWLKCKRLTMPGVNEAVK